MNTASDVFNRLHNPMRLLLPTITITGHNRTVTRFLTLLRRERPGIDEQFRILVHFSKYLPKHRVMVEGIGPGMMLITCKPTYPRREAFPAARRLYKTRKRRM